MLTYRNLKTGQTMVVNHVTGEAKTLAQHATDMMDYTHGQLHRDADGIVDTRKLFGA